MIEVKMMSSFQEEKSERYQFPLDDQKEVRFDRFFFIKVLLIITAVIGFYQVPWTYFSDGTGFTGRVLDDPKPTENVVEKLYFGPPMIFSYILDIMVALLILWLLIRLLTRHEVMRTRDEVLQFLQESDRLGLIIATAPFILSTLGTILSWYQYMTYLGTIHLDILLWISIFSTLQGLVTFFAVYLTWEALVMNQLIKDFQLTYLPRYHGLPYRWKIVLIAFIIPMMTIIIILFPGYYLRHVIGLSVSRTDDLILTYYGLLTGMITILIEIPIVYNFISVNERMKRVFDLLNARSPIKDVFSPEDRPKSLLKQMIIRSADENALIVSAFNQFVNSIEEMTKNMLDSARKTETFFEEVVGTINEIVTSSASIVGSMEETSAGTQRMSDLAVQLEERLINVETELANLMKESLGIKKQITTLLSRLQILALNVTIETSRLGEHAKSLDPLSREMRRITNDMKMLNDTLIDTIDRRISEVRTMFSETIDAYRDITELSQDISANAQEVTATIEEETALLRDVNDRVEELTGMLKSLSRQIEGYASHDII